MKAFRLATLLMVLLLVAEVWLRSGSPDLLSFSRIIKPSDNKIMGYELRPGARAAYCGMVHKIPETLVEISPQGFRDRAIALNNPHVTRVAFVGNSYIFGQGLNLKETVPKRLEDFLNSRSSVKYEVMNCGVPGYNLEQEIEFIKKRVMPYHPDIIILFIGPNDIERKIMLLRSRISNALFAGSYVYRRMIFLITELRQKKDRKGIDYQVRRDNTIRSFRELRGFLPNKQRVVLVIKNFTPWMEPIVNIAKANGFPVLDFTRDWIAFKDNIIIARQDQHFNPLGAELMAKRIYDLLIREVIKSDDRNVLDQKDPEALSALS